MAFPALELLLAPIPDDDSGRPSPHRRAEESSATSLLTEDDGALIARVRDGDRDAFATIHALHWAGLVRYAERITHSAEAARDVVQDVFLDLWIQRAKWTVHSSIAAYLYTAVRGRFLRLARHARVEHQYAHRVSLETFAAGGTFGTGSPESDAETAALLAIVDRVLGELPPRCREAFVLYRQHGLELTEVAHIMQTSVGTVKVQLRRAVAALRMALGVGE